MTLLELYSSEGCSSCPPADRWLSTLKDSPALWKTIVPVCFHVTYWDRLGWKDPFGDEVFTERQRAYAQAWGDGGVYTPGFVAGGEEWRRFFDGGEARPPAASGRAGGVLEVRATGTGTFAVAYAPPAGTKGPFEIHGAALVFGAKSAVRAGENRGRDLVHDFLARSLVSSKLEARDGSWSATVSLAWPSDGGSMRGAAFWITEGDDPRPLQATGGFITSENAAPQR
ncbi:MAG: DUF1223 domain-containing protein [Acidobacteriota bacterium]